VADLALGALDVGQFALVLCLITFANALFTTSAIAREDRASRAYSKRDLLRLILLGPLDLVAYRPLIVYARAKGAWRFLRGDKGWHKFQRNDRPASATSA
jgi:hypothetical protein